MLLLLILFPVSLFVETWFFASLFNLCSFLCLCLSAWASCFLCLLHSATPGESSSFDRSIFFVLITLCVLDGCDDILVFRLVSNWCGGRRDFFFCAREETSSSRSFFGLTSCQLLFFEYSLIHAPILRFFHVCQRFLSQLCRTISCGGPRIYTRSTDPRVYPLNRLSPLMSMSSEFANSPMDLCMNSSCDLFTERVAKFLNDDLCTWASIAFWKELNPRCISGRGSRLVLPFGKVISSV